MGDKARAAECFWRSDQLWECMDTFYALRDEAGLKGLMQAAVEEGDVYLQAACALKMKEPARLEGLVAPPSAADRYYCPPWLRPYRLRYDAYSLSWQYSLRIRNALQWLMPLCLPLALILFDGCILSAFGNASLSPQERCIKFMHCCDLRP